MSEKNIRKSLFRWKISVAAVSVLVIAFFPVVKNLAPKGTNARISVNGQAVMEIRLADAKDGVISLRERHGVPVDFEIRNRSIRFINVECPDHICEKTGFVGSKGETAVCMPNKTSVAIN